MQSTNGIIGRALAGNLPLTDENEEDLDEADFEAE